MPQDSYEPETVPNRYFDKNFDCDAVKILPGEYYATTRDLMIVTVLGSCVSVCLRDRSSGIGGMNHFMLPDNVDAQNPVAGKSARYGVYAMDMLINNLLKLGAARNRLEAKVAGAGKVLRGFEANNVGERNATFVVEYLNTEKIPIISQDLLGIYPRKVYFFPTQGRVLVRKLMSMHNNTILEREAAYRGKLKSTRVEGDAELF